MGVINTVQYQIPQLGFINPIANPTGANVEKLVNQTLLLDDPVKVINASLNMWYPSSLYPCVPWGNGESVNPTLQLDSFNYLLCKYFPLSVNEVPDGTIFVPTAVQTETDPQTCMTKYNITPSTQDRVETQYHITRDELVNAKRILFAYNEFDPTTAVGIQPLPLTQDRNASRYMFTTLSSHGEESLASYPGDRPSVVHVSRRIPSMDFNFVCKLLTWPFRRQEICSCRRSKSGSVCTRFDDWTEQAGLGIRMELICSRGWNDIHSAGSGVLNLQTLIM
jgi:dipeptidyl-peptidase-2/lysosomal Pro-X carboxypeptidase